MYYCDGKDNGVEEEGLLPPLRRPNLDEIPQELLPFLQMKTTDLNMLSQEMLANILNSQMNLVAGEQRNNVTNSGGQQRQPSSNMYSGGPNVVNVTTSQIKTSSQNIVQNTTDVRNSSNRNPPQSQGQNRSTVFSPVAKEFVPKQYSLQSSDTTDLAMAVAQVQANYQSQFPNQNSQNSSLTQNDSDNNTDCVLSTVTDTINQLTINPPDFQRCAKATTDVLKQYLSDADILGIVVTLIVEQSINNVNFCYSGARLCQVLHKNDIKTPTASFKVLLISRCQEEFQSCLKNSTKDAASLKRTHGFLRFLGELYMNFHIEQGGKTVPITIFGLAATELMSDLIKTSPNHENIKFVFQLLKLLGWEFENAADVRLKSEMEKFIKDLSYILALKKVPDPTLKLLEALFLLKGKNWNKSEELDSVQPQTGNNAVASHCSFSQAQYFELPEEVDDEDFDTGNILLEDEPDEVGEAYDAFLKGLESGRRK